MINILLTGGAGYIGSHVAYLLKNEGYKVYVIDDLSTGHKENLVFGEFFNINVGDESKLRELFQSVSFDACLHFAGSIQVEESVKNPLMYYFNNSINSARLIKVCTDFNIKHFIFSSTAAVYGPNESGVCSETTVLGPSNPYGRTKLQTEQVLIDAASVNDFTYAILRYFNVAGADYENNLGQRSKVSTHLIKIASELAASKRDKMYVFGEDYNTPDGTCIRDYIHVSDLAYAHVLALNYLLKGGQSDIFNVGYGRGLSVKEVISSVEKMSGKKLNVQIADRRPGDAPILVADNKKITRVLGFSPRFKEIDTIVNSAYQWEKSI